MEIFNLTTMANIKEYSKLKTMVLYKCLCNTNILLTLAPHFPYTLKSWEKNNPENLAKHVRKADNNLPPPPQMRLQFN